MNTLYQISENVPALSNVPVVTIAFFGIVAATGLLWSLSRKADFAVVSAAAVVYAAVPLVLIWSNR